MTGTLPRNPVIIESTVKHMQHTLVHYLSGYEQEMQDAITEEVERAFAAFDIRAMVAQQVRDETPELMQRIISQAVRKALWSEEVTGLLNRLSLRAVADLLERGEQP